MRSLFSTGSAHALDGTPKLSGLDPAAWVTASRTPDAIRRAIGATAKGERRKEEKKAWFKQEASGEQLGSLLIQYWSEIEDHATRPWPEGTLRLRLRGEATLDGRRPPDDCARGSSRYALFG